MFEAIIKQMFGECVREYRFHPTRKFRFDYAIPSKKIAIEQEGGAWTNGRHTRGKGYTSDMEKYNLATSMGWRVLRFTPEQMMKTETINLIKKVYDN